jgi:nicotinate-nucleotide pyrophosphorylase (carboxylating)
VRETFAQVDAAVEVRFTLDDGAALDAGSVIAEVVGPLASIVTGERTALNFCCHLSGVATLTRRYVEAAVAANPSARVWDTRKTTPGLRALEKAAVAAGGATNHRAGLYDAILIKENHIAAAGGIAQAIERARAQAPELAGTLEVEVRNPDEIEQALAAGAPRMLLDNMDESQLRAAVAQVAGCAELEASGGVTLQSLRALAQTGIEWVSMGALTHSAPALDLSLIMEARP